MYRFSKTVVRLAVLSCVALFVGTPALAQSEASRPLSEYTIEDLFYIQSVENIEREGNLARAWVQDAGTMADGIELRKERAKSVREVLKAEIETLKKKRDLASKEKDEPEKARLQAEIESAESTVKVLEQIVRLTDQDHEFAKAWEETGEALMMVSDAALNVSHYRNRRVARMRDGETIDDEGLRLESEAEDLYTKLIVGYKEAAKKLKKMGEEMERLSEHRSKLFDELRKGGHIQSP